MVQGQQPRPLVIGHRGALYREVENTIEGFVKAHELGCDAVELDVFLLKCGTLVVFHGGGCDKNPGLLSTYCGIEGCILDYTAEEAKTLLKFVPNGGEFGYFRPSGDDNKLGGATIPTLEEVLLVCKELDGLTVKIELKGEGTVEPVLEMVERLDMVKKCHFASFNLERVQLVREMRPDKSTYRTGALYSGEPPNDFLEVAARIGVNEIHLRYDACTKDRIDAIHDAGFVSMAWFRGPNAMEMDTCSNYLDVGNEDESMYETVLSSGVKSMCVNRPDVLLKHLVSRRVRGQALQYASRSKTAK
jgi:glycerophosphoryl diester phosphodiesterase